MCELQKKTNIKPASSFDNFKSNNPRFWHILKLNVILVAKLRKKLTFCGTKNLTTPILLIARFFHASRRRRRTSEWVFVTSSWTSSFRFVSSHMTCKRATCLARGLRLTRSLAYLLAWRHHSDVIKVVIGILHWLCLLVLFLYPCMYGKPNWSRWSKYIWIVYKTQGR